MGLDLRRKQEAVDKYFIKRINKLHDYRTHKPVLVYRHFCGGLFCALK